MRVVVIFAIILFLILSTRFLLFFSIYHEPKAGDSFEQKFTLLADTRETNFYQTFRVGSIQIQTLKYPKYKFGDKLQIKGKIEKTSFDSNGKKVEQLVVKNPQINQLDQDNKLFQSTTFVRGRIKSTFNNYLPKNESALLIGIILGGSSDFSKDLLSSFQKTGVLHVIAASGMNVTMVAGFLFAAFSSLLSRRKAIVLSILGVFYYTILAGMGPSIVRAAIMGSIVFTAAILGRKNVAFVSLFLTGFIMLFINPLTLFDVSFQLSFLSTLGILTIKPILDSIRILKRIPLIPEDISTTVSAQAGSLPILAKTFSFYSLTSIVVNGLVLWTIPILMVTGGIAAICSIALPFVSVPLLYISYPLLLYFEKVVMVFSNIPGLDLSESSWFIWIGYYLIILAIIIKLHKKK